MKLAPKAENPLDFLALALGLVPTPLIDSSWGPMLGRIIPMGVKLGVFDALAGGPLTAVDVAGKTGCNSHAIEPFLNALNGFGYLKKRGERYVNTRSSQRWLTSKSPSSVRDAIEFMPLLQMLSEDMEKVIRTGKTQNIHHREFDDGFWRTYLRGLGSFAMTAGREVAMRVKLAQKPKRLIDIGGGHGGYSIAFCKRYPGLTATVFDLPPAVKQGAAYVAEKGFTSRISFEEGDIRTSTLSGGYDVALIFNVLHNLTAAEGEVAIQKAYNALAPGGTLVICESEHAGKGNISSSAGFSELLFLILSGAGGHPEPLMKTWMADAGFKTIKKTKLLILPMTILLSGRK